MKCLIFAMVAGKRVLISEETIRADLLFDDADVTLPSKVFTFMRKNSPKFSGRITPLTPPMLEVITALAAEEAHSESTHSRAESSPRDAQGTPTQSAAQASILQGTADFQGTAEAQGAADIPQSPNDYTPTDASRILRKEERSKRGEEGERRCLQSNWEKKDEGNLSEEHHDQDDHNHIAFEDFDATDAIEEEKDTSDVKSDETEQTSAVTRKDLIFDDEEGPSVQMTTQEEEPEEQFKDDEFLADILLNRPRGLSIPGPMQSHLKNQLKLLDPKEKGKGILKGSSRMGCIEERKRLEDLKKPKPKTISKKPTSLAQERTQMMSFLKGQGYKNLQKLRYPQMKELYDKIQESIKDSLKDFIHVCVGSEKEKQMLQERDAKRLLRKRKATVTEEQPSKKLKLRTEKIDELETN
ncbi:hypothetical protein Tco_1195757 [Tanacetum coccineum]